MKHSFDAAVVKHGTGDHSRAGRFVGCRITGWMPCDITEQRVTGTEAIKPTERRQNQSIALLSIAIIITDLQNPAAQRVIYTWCAGPEWSNLKALLWSWWQHDETSNEALRMIRRQNGIGDPSLNLQKMPSYNSFSLTTGALTSIIMILVKQTNLAIKLAAPLAVRGGKNSSEKNTSLDATRSWIRSIKLTYFVAGKNVIGELGRELESSLLAPLMLYKLEFSMQPLSTHIRDFVFNFKSGMIKLDSYAWLCF